MGPDTRDAITWTLGTLVTASVLLGMGVRFILLPWLRDHLVQPVRETHRQVAENGHTRRDHPTIPDRLEDLSVKVDEATEAHAVQTRDLAAVAVAVGHQQATLRDHLRLSERWMNIVDRELALLKGEHEEEGTEDDKV
jgi:hypothetical protein